MGGMGAGVLVAALIIFAGATAAAWCAITLSALLIAAGAIDWVRTR